MKTRPVARLVLRAVAGLALTAICVGPGLVYFSDTSSPPIITPVRSAADFLTYRIGFTVGVR